MSLQWLSLVGAIWLQSVNGTNSNFPAYSSQLKRLLSMSQLQLNNLAFASDAGKLLGWFSGVAADHLPLWVVLLIGSILGLIGYGVQFLFLTNHISSLSYSQVFLLTVVAGNSVCWINTVCYIVSIRNFPLDRQIAVGLSTSYVGLSAKIYTAIVDTLFSYSPENRAKAYLLLNSVFPLAACFLTSPIVREINGGKSRNLSNGFIIMFVITIATGIYAVISSLGPMILKTKSPLVLLMGMGLFLLAPLAIPLVEELKEMVKKQCEIRREPRVYCVSVEEEVINEINIESGVAEKENESDGGTEICEIGVTKMLRMLDFWLYFFVYLFGATIGLVYLNNLGQIAESRGSKISSLVSLSSSFGFFGRLVPSLLDYFLSRNKYVISRAALIAAMIAPMSGAFFLLLSKLDVSLYISTAVVGTCTGAITSLSVSTTAELFGAKNFGVNHNVLVANIPVGSFIFGDSAALLYRRKGDHNGRCIGMDCYRTTFVVWGCLCLFGTLLALILHARTRKILQQKT